ncbi:MAG: Mur ligase family protein, partial [Mycobacterium sp.]
ALSCLAEEGVTVDSVPAAGRWIPLRRTANITTGGTAEDVTDSVHPDNRRLAERAARVVGLDIAGVDFLTTDISRSWHDVGGAICEVNAQPGFRNHWMADPDRDINGEIVDIIFGRRSGRIPTAAITGTNGKTTKSTMLHHIWMTAGKHTGICATPAVRVGYDDVITKLNRSGLEGAEMLLKDPAVEAAVFEMPHKGLIYLGHPCDRYEVAAMLNVTDDHIGTHGIESVQQMAELKAQVLERAERAVVINADDPLCMAMRSRAGTPRHILVTRRPDAPAVRAHRDAGGEAVFIADRDGESWIVLATGAAEEPLMGVSAIPATMNGLLRVNEMNAMFAAGLAWAQGVELNVVRRALGSFSTSPEQNPGRFNFIGGLEFQVVLDYAHNPDGFRELCSVVSQLPVAGRRLLMTKRIGNRHAAHFTEVATMMVKTFDDIIVSGDPKWIGQNAEYAGQDPVGVMLSTSRQRLLDHGGAPDRITLEPNGDTAIQMALETARAGDLVVVLADPHEALPLINDFVRSRQDREGTLYPPG